MTAPALRLSIIIPFYDETAYLRMAVGSILAQGLREVEVIVVNDNPARFTPDDIAALRLPASVKVLHHDQNRGLPAARNTGVAASNGDLIGFLDADDYYLTDGLARQVQLAQDSEACITQANCLMTKHGLPDQVPLTRETELFAQPLIAAGLAKAEEAQFITSSWSSLYRRDFLEENGLKFDEAQVKFEDRLFVLQTVTAARKIAFLGRANRVWRRRAGSISTSKPDAAVLLLQLQLLEKCLDHVRSRCGTKPTGHPWFKREAFNTISRLIWDIDLVPALAEGADPVIADLGPRVVALLQDCQLGNQIFDDPVVRRVSRVGITTRKGIIRRVDFFAFAKAARAGDFAAAAAVLAERRPVPATPAPATRPTEGPRLVLHLGMHKTGSTALQTLMAENREALRSEGVLFPKTGYATPEFAAVRHGGNPGHLGLLFAHRRGDEAVWQALWREVDRSDCHTVVISCENMLLPMDGDRGRMLAALMARFDRFRAVDVVAFVRRPDLWAEMFFRELVSNGNRMGARSLPEFLVDYEALLTDLPALFGPIEAATDQRVKLIDHDASAPVNQHWQRFATAAGLPARVFAMRPDAEDPIYASPGREAILAAQMLTGLIAEPARRQMALRGFFAGLDRAGPARSLLPKGHRLALLDAFAAKSSEFAAERGYTPDSTAMRADIEAEDWAPVTAIPFDLLERVSHAMAQTGLPEPEPDRTAKRDFPPRDPYAMNLKIRLRPWARRILDRLRGRV